MPMPHFEKQVLAIETNALELQLNRVLVQAIKTQTETNGAAGFVFTGTVSQSDEDLRIC